MADQEVRLRELLEESSNLRELIESVGWRELMETAAEQLQLRMPGVLSKLENILELPAQEFEKGAISGIELFCALPGIRRESLDQDIQQLEEELDYDPAERSTDDGDRGDIGDGGDTFEPPAPGVRRT